MVAGGLAARAQSSSLQFVAVSPCRIVDTRGTNNPVQGGTFQSFAIQGSQGACSNIPASAAAYSLNVTVVPHSTLNYLTVWPSGQTQPVVSTLNSPDGRIKANAAIVGAGSGAGGAVSVYATDTTDVILDLDGYFAPSGSSTLAFYPVTPCRIADTRKGQSLPGGQEADFPVSGMCNIPSGAAAYSLNFTAIPYEPLNYLSVWPKGQSQPVVSTLNSPTGTVVANAAMVVAGDAGEIAVYPTDKIDLVIDINGYYAPASSAPGGLSLFTLTPCRVLDTRSTTGQFSGALTVNALANSCGLPSLAQAIVANATVVPPGPMGYLTLWPNGQPQPLASTLNAYDGEITSNLAVVPTSNGFINAYASDPTQLIVDLFSYFAVPSGLNGSYAFDVTGYNNPSSGGPPPPPCSSGGQFMMVGSFVANGNGTISGLLDLNCTGGKPTLHLNFQGTYSIRPDGLGTITLTPTLNPSFHLSVAISSTGGGRLALQNESSSYLPNAWGSGAIRLQNPADLSLQQIGGNFASVFSGADSNLNRYAGGGTYQINQTGNVQGTVDTNDNGTLQKLLPTAGVLGTPDPQTGRGTAMFVTSGITTRFIYYITSANELSLLSSDLISSTAPLVQQTMLRQSSASFDNTYLNGISVVRTSGIAQSQNKPKRQDPASAVPDIVLGLLTTDGNGNGSVSYDENVGGTLTQNQPPPGTYNTASDGRVELKDSGGNTIAVSYLVRKNQAFIISESASVASGFFLQQSDAPFSNASAIGTYWGGTYMPVTSGVTDAVTTAFADANGNLTGTINTTGPSGNGTQPLNATYQIDSTGRAVITENGSPAAIMYVISPTQVALISATDSSPAVVVLGSTN